jgi:hypothetical protein
MSAKRDAPVIWGLREPDNGPDDFCAQIILNLLLCAGRIVLGTQGPPVLVHSTSALARDVEDFAEISVRPNFRPLRVPIGAEGFTELVGGGLEIIFQ